MIPDLLQVFVGAMTPVGELRLSIPLGILRLGLPWLTVLLVSIVGNMAPVVVLLFGLDRVSPFLDGLPGPAGRLWAWRTARVRDAHGERMARYGPLALIVIVAIPLPMTGAWTGSLAAWLFHVPIRLALPAIFAGVVIAGLIVTALVEAGMRVGFLLVGE